MPATKNNDCRDGQQQQVPGKYPDGREDFLLFGRSAEIDHGWQIGKIRVAVDRILNQQIDLPVLQPIGLDGRGSDDVAAAAEDRSRVGAPWVPADAGRPGRDVKRRERALATGIFNAGSNVGVMVSAAMVPWVTLKFGWQTAFAVTGALGFVWLVPWLASYQVPQKQSKVSPSELAVIESDPADPVVKVSWLDLAHHRSTWAYVIATFLTAPVWWFYLFWVPDFLFKNLHFDLKSVGLPLILVYLIGDVGSVAGGGMSALLMRRGCSLNSARKLSLLTCALCVLPIIAASSVQNPWVATVLIGIAAAAHQGWSANLYTLASDTHPKQVVSSVIGMGGMAGAIGGMFMAKFVGQVLSATHSYVLLFAIAPTAYLLAVVVIHLLVPKVEMRAH